MHQEELFEKHTPRFPLPDEILKMKKDETVCHFCGVSYLIHTEIKRLEDRIKELEKQLVDYDLLKAKEIQFSQITSEQNLRIQDLEEKLSTRVQMLSSLNNDIDLKELDINRLKKKNQDLEDENNMLSVEKENLKKKMLKHASVVKETMLSLSEQKSDLKRLELIVKEQKNTMTQYFTSTKGQLEVFIVKSQKASFEKSDEINNLKSQLDNILQKNAHHNEQVDYYEKKIDSLNTVKNELNSQVAILNSELEKSNGLSFRCISLEKENRKLLDELSQLKTEIQNLNFKLTTTSNETSETKQMISSFQETINSNKFAHERELKLKTDEILKLKNELDSIKKRYDEKDKFEKEILNNHQVNLHEVATLKYEIKKLNEKIMDFENEKNAITLAHQCQITQLKDNFKEKYRLNEEWPEKLANELNKEREKSKQELLRQEAKLQENFKMEFDIQQQKYNEMYAKYQQISKDFEGNSKSRINDLENEKAKLAHELKNLHDDKVTIEKKLRQDLENLRNITKELHQRLEKYTNDETDVNNTKLKEDLIQKNSKINELECLVKSFEAQLESSKEELRILQETVHNECLERQELHEKLDEARDELLELKKNAYSSQQLIPLKASLNQSNFSSFKNGTGLIDVNNPPEKLKPIVPSVNPSYPRTLNEMVNSQTSLNTDSNSPQTGGRRQPYLSPINRSSSEKSNAESTSKVIEPFHNKTNMSRVLSLTNNNINGTNEPIQLFRKINEMSTVANTKQQASNLSFTENKKRISLLLARKS